MKKLQTAYRSGETRVAPPSMPESHASMMKYMIVGMVLVGIGSVLVFIILSSSEFSWFQLGVTLLFIIIALILSFMAIRHIGQADEEARQRYPIWDEAMANWNRLLFCTRDRVIFDPAAKKVLSDSAVSSLLSMDQLEVRQPVQAQAASSH